MTRTLRLIALAVGLWATACSAQSDSATLAGLTIEQVMTRGPASAPVTIVEFSDYQ